MIKYKGFAVAPAEVEATLMEHPAVRDCGVVGCADEVAGEIPCAFIVLRDGGPGSDSLKKDSAPSLATASPTTNNPATSNSSQRFRATPPAKYSAANCANYSDRSCRCVNEGAPHLPQLAHVGICHNFSLFSLRHADRRRAAAS